jgi:uncharacterized protein YggT (Ycf19 family)
MSHIIGLFFDVLILGLIVHWVLGFIRSSQYDQVEKVRVFLDKVYSPFLDVIKNKIKPLVKRPDGNQLDFSPLIFLVILAIARKLAHFIF